MEKESIFKSIVATVGTMFSALFGAWDIALQILVLFVVLDYLTGMLRGIINKDLSSNAGFKGIAKKSVIFIVLIVGVSLDRLLNTGQWVFRSLICYFYIANEGISILENCGALGLPLPEKLKDTLIQLKEGNRKGDK
ncbi:phage holin family protein [Clostridium hydrogeniformans]|uniref:phage holin family protein n=1 Tax=Clostridium hydrogeniformans TaxID=349933 RepID=UPI000480F8DC|nr:phage holin family protein [Clostridium hydrogeniformans]